MGVNFGGARIFMDSVGVIYICVHIPQKYKPTKLPYSRKVWRIDSFRAFGERKFGELIDQPIGY